VKVVKGKSEETAAKEATPKIWKDLKSATKNPPKAKKAKKVEKVADAPASEPEAVKESAEKPKTKNVKKSVKGTQTKGAPDLTPLYKVEEKPAKHHKKPAPAATKEKEEPTKIVVHIKAAE